MAQDDTKDGGPYEGILAQLMNELNAGRHMQLEELISRYPADASAAKRAFADYERYRRLRFALVHPGVATHAELLSAGSRLGDFEVVGLLATGGMSTVYRARQLSLGGREVALKVTPSGKGRPGERFRREALALAGLHHAHLAEVYGFGEDRGLLFLAMKLAEGPTLRNVLERVAARSVRRGVIEQRQLVRWVSQVAAALEEVHGRGLVHRDVKPSNVVIQSLDAASVERESPPDTLPRGDAVLVDFGLVRPIDPGLATLTRGLPATPSYAPPEQLLGGDLSPAADVFSLGVTVHDLLAGRLPEERLQASLGLEPLRDLTDIDRDLAAVVSRAVDPDVQWRYADSSELRADLDAWLSGRPVSARRLHVGERARRWFWRDPRRTALALAALIAVAVLGIGGYALVVSLEGATAAKRALDRGDLRMLQDGLRRVPATLNWALLSSELRGAAHRVRQASGNTSLGAVLTALDTNDHKRALFEAARHLRRSAHGEDPFEPLIGTFLVAELERAAFGLRAGSWQDEPLLYERFVPLVARLLYEIDRESDQPVSASWIDEMRPPLLDILNALSSIRDPDLAPTSLFALTALSGCGQVSDLQRIAPLVMEKDAETRRLALRAMERIVRRANRSDTSMELSPELCKRLWDTYGDLAAQRFAYVQPDRASSLLIDAAEALHYALLLASRRISSCVPSDFGGDYFATAGPTPPLTWMKALAISADPRLPSLFARTKDASLDWARVGQAAGLYGDQVLADALRERASRLGYQIEFDAGRRQGVSETRGYISGEALDAATFLGSTVDIDYLPPPSRFVGTIPHDPSGNLDQYGHAHAAPVDPLAFWVFARQPLHGGTAAPFSAIGSVGETEHADYLKLWSFGKSRVVLPFDFYRKEEDRPRRLWVFHQLASRTYFPYQGEAFVDVHLNGYQIGTLRCGRREGEEATVNVPQDVLRDGRNELALQLTDATTTTYRIFEAWVE